jgi:hypothetical protein
MHHHLRQADRRPALTIRSQGRHVVKIMYLTSQAPPYHYDVEKQEEARSQATKTEQMHNSGKRRSSFFEQHADRS